MEETLNPESIVSLPDSGIPEYYEKNVLRALPCNPSQLFVYWKLPQPAASRCTAITVTLFEKTSVTDDNPLPLLEIPVEPQAQSHYITVPYPGIAYTVVLTAAFSGGVRATLRSTGTLQLPAAPGNCTSNSTDTSENVDYPSLLSTPPSARKTTTGKVKAVLSPTAAAAPVNPSSWSHREQRLR